MLLHVQTGVLQAARVSFKLLGYVHFIFAFYAFYFALYVHFILLQSLEKQATSYRASFGRPAELER